MADDNPKPKKKQKRGPYRAPKRAIGLRPPGRPQGMSRRSPDGVRVTMEIILAGKRIGLGIRECCSRALVSESFYFDHQRYGMTDIMAGKENTIDAQFVREIEKSESDRIAKALESIQKVGMGGDVVVETTETVDPDGGTTITKRNKVSSPAWQANAWLLERTRPELYSLKGRGEESVTAGNTPLSDKIPPPFTDEEAKFLASALLRRRMEQASLAINATVVEEVPK